MRRRLFVPMLVAALLLAFGTIAAACGDDDGGRSDEDAVRDAFEVFAQVQNNFAEGPDRMAEIATERFLAGWCSEFMVKDPQILSVSVAEVGDRKIATAKGSRTENGETIEATLTFVKEGDRWLIDNVAERPPFVCARS